MAPLGTLGWEVAPSFENGPNETRGKDWERRLYAREQAVADAELRLQQMTTKQERGLQEREEALAAREEFAREAAASAADRAAAADRVAAANERAREQLAAERRRLETERAELANHAARRDADADERERDVERRLDAARKTTEHEAEQTRHAALVELKQVQQLVADAQMELERLAGDKAEAAAAILAARKDASAARVNVEGEIASWGKDAVRAQAEAETARGELAAVIAERDRVKAGAEAELREMREMREAQAAARMSERAAADAAHAAAVAEINDKVEHLRQMSRGYEDQARAVEARIAESQAEVEAARESARAANERSDRVEGEAAAARAEAAEHAAIARAALEEATRDRESLVERAATLESDGRAIDVLRKQIQDEAVAAVEGREKVLREWEERMSAAERAAKNKARDAEDSVRRWAIEVKRREEGIDAMTQQVQRERNKAEQAKREALAEQEELRKQRYNSDAMRTDAGSMHSAAENDRAAAAKLRGEAEGMNKAATAQREELASRSSALDRREREIREALDELREREDKAGAAVAKATAAAQEHERRIAGLAAKEASADERERAAAQGAAAAEATLLAAGQWERSAGEREAALAARAKEVDDKLLATEAASNEARRNLELARVARDGLAEADIALTDREHKLNDSWRTLQGEVTALLQGDMPTTGSGDAATEERVAIEAREAAAAAAAFTVVIPHAIAGPAAEEAFAAQLGKMRGGLVQRETALQRWALSLSKAAAALAAERKFAAEERRASAELRSSAESAAAGVADRLSQIEEQANQLVGRGAKLNPFDPWLERRIVSTP